jgi:hypothetical protein
VISDMLGSTKLPSGSSTDSLAPHSPINKLVSLLVNTVEVAWLVCPPRNLGRAALSKVRFVAK